MSRPSGDGPAMRAVGMLLHPGRTWDQIEAEPPEGARLLWRYVAPLAAIPAVCRVIGTLTFGLSIAYIGVQVSWMALTLGAIVNWLVTLGSVYLLAILVNLLAPAFGGERDRGQALKLVAYAGTASWVGGLAELYPNLGLPVAILAGLYSLYALFLGLPKLMRIPNERRLTAFAAVLVAILALAGLRSGLSSRAAELGGPLSASYAPPT